MLSREINYEREENKDVKWKVERWKNYERRGGSVFRGYKEVELRGVVADKNFFPFLEYYVDGVRNISPGHLKEIIYFPVSTNSGSISFFSEFHSTFSSIYSSSVK